MIDSARAVVSRLHDPSLCCEHLTLENGHHVIVSDFVLVPYPPLPPVVTYQEDEDGNTVEVLSEYVFNALHFYAACKGADDFTYYTDLLGFTYYSDDIAWYEKIDALTTYVATDPNSLVRLRVALRGGPPYIEEPRERPGYQG